MLHLITYLCRCRIWIEDQGTTGCNQGLRWKWSFRRGCVWCCWCYRPVIWPVALDLIMNLFSGCISCVKWNTIYSVSFPIDFGVRQGSVPSPVLFALLVDDVSSMCTTATGGRGCIILYADDILLIAPSVMMLERLLHICEDELDHIDMVINCKKSCCIRIGPRCMYRVQLCVVTKVIVSCA